MPGSSSPLPPVGTAAGRAGGGATAAEFANWRRGGGAWVPVAAEGAAWTVVSRERERERERSAVLRSLGSSIPSGGAGVWEVSVGASPGHLLCPGESVFQ